MLVVHHLLIEVLTLLVVIHRAVGASAPSRRWGPLPPAALLGRRRPGCASRSRRPTRPNRPGRPSRPGRLATLLLVFQLDGQRAEHRRRFLPLPPVWPPSDDRTAICQHERRQPPVLRHAMHQEPLKRRLGRPLLERKLTDLGSAEHEIPNPGFNLLDLLVELGLLERTVQNLVDLVHRIRAFSRAVLPVTSLVSLVSLVSVVVVVADGRHLLPSRSLCSSSLVTLRLFTLVGLPVRVSIRARVPPGALDDGRVRPRRLDRPPGHPAPRRRRPLKRVHPRVAIRVATGVPDDFPCPGSLWLCVLATHRLRGRHDEREPHDRGGHD